MVKFDGMEMEVPTGARMALRLICALAAGACAAAAAPAAEKAAPLIPSWKQSHLKQGDQAVQAVYRLAACTRIKRRDAAEALLATNPGSPEEAAGLRLAMPSDQTDCRMGVRSLKIHSTVFARGAVAEALYNGDGRKPRTASALPLTETYRPSGDGSELVVARWVARCAVRREPRLAHGVVKRGYGSIGEERSLGYLRPAFLACLPKGERLQVSRLNIRALIAEELYRASVTFKESFANAKG
ncbi:MAG TPA: hypothetical protein VF688_03505 [Allosphingosinicella sp.]